MRYLISYDISDTKKRNKVVKYLESFCYRVQYSVFLCVHEHVRVETIAKKLEILTRGDETGDFSSSLFLTRPRHLYGVTKRFR